jgi:predicted lipid carrier protein YhbT
MKKEKREKKEIKKKMRKINYDSLPRRLGVRMELVSQFVKLVWRTAREKARGRKKL